MPPNNHLQWVEITDFAPGVFTVSDWLIPPNGSQIMEDCYPQVGGGLRAFVKPTALTTTGIVDAATEQVIGCYVHYPGYRHGVGNRADYFIATVDTSNRVSIYRYDLSDDATTWVRVAYWAAGAGAPQPVQFAKFRDAAGAYWILAGFYSVSTDDGLYKIDWSQTGPSQTATKIVHPYAGAGRRFGPTLAVQDDRILVVEWPNILWYSDSQALTFSASNYLPLASSSASNMIHTIMPFAPSDLLIGLSSEPWHLVQGDITDPVVRSMSKARTPGAVQMSAFTQNGLAFLGYKVGVFVTSTGETFQDLSAQIAPSTWDILGGDVGIGDLGYDGNLLFAPSGLVFDFRTNGWFTTSKLSDAAAHRGHHFAAAPQKRVLASATGSGVELWNYDVAEASTSRCPSYTWKSAPLRAPDGRQMEIREVQVYARGYNAGSTLTVTVGTKTKTLPVGAAKQMVSFLMVQRAEVLDVQVVSASNDPDVEAPSIEAVRIGAGYGHLSH